MHDNHTAHGRHGQPLQHHAQLILPRAHIEPRALCEGYLCGSRGGLAVHLTCTTPPPRQIQIQTFAANVKSSLSCSNSEATNLGSSNTMQYHPQQFYPAATIFVWVPRHQHTTSVLLRQAKPCRTVQDTEPKHDDTLYSSSEVRAYESGVPHRLLHGGEGGCWMQAQELA